MPETRRTFLKKAALLSGAASVSQLLPESVLRALAITPPEGSSWKDAEHVVILMQENRSFDHALGTLRGVRGYNDPRAIQLPNRNLVWLQSDAAGQTYAPFRLDIHNSKATWMSSLPHSWANQVEARNDGKYDQWLNVKRNSIREYADIPLTMGYHTREDLPFYYALADAFTVCDQSFCSSLTGTNPNRLYFWTGTVRAEQREDSRAHVWNEDMDYGTLGWTTFPERLEALGVSWKCYQNEVAIETGFEGEQDPWLSNFQDNPLEFFGQYHVRLYPRHVAFVRAEKQRVEGEIGRLREQIAGLAQEDSSATRLQTVLDKQQQYLTRIDNHPAILSGLSFDGLTPAQQALHKKAFDVNSGDPDYRVLDTLQYLDGTISREMKAPKGDVLHQFREDVRSGKLPTVSWLSAPENFSDHPSAPWYGAWYVSEVMDILTHDPEVWKKTIFILAYDENDGYFDHVPPFTVPNPHREGTGKVSGGLDTRVDFVSRDQELSREGFPEPFDRACSIGLGFRVPLIIASPWSRGGWVNSQVFDHTSTLQFLERFLSHKLGQPVREENISEWRRTVCGDLTSVFRPYPGGAIAEPDIIPRDAFLESIHKAQFRPLPNDYHALSPDEIAAFNKTPEASPYATSQEPGTRPSCAIPYSMLADGKLSADRTRFEIAFRNDRRVFGAQTAGAPFNVYAPGNHATGGRPGDMEAVRTWAYAVKAGDTLSDTWRLQDFAGGKYRLRVYGPNGFFREFAGDAQDPPIEVRFEPAVGGNSSQLLSGNGVVRLLNKGRACLVHLTDHAYGGMYPSRPVQEGAQADIALPIAANHGWYDFSVRVSGHVGFERRYAGRIDTGRDSISDPFMGRVVSG